MKVSVIIPTYKPQSYLWECLDSLVLQTLPHEDWELLLVLNGCKEPWYTKIRNYLADKMADMNVTLVQTDTPGVSNARNVALDRASGEYVTFIDDDDFISPNYLEEMLRVATPHTVSLCYPYAFNDGMPHRQLPYAITEAYEHCSLHGCGPLSSRVRKFYSGPWMKLIPMDIIRERRYDPRFTNGEDSLFMFLISDSIKENVMASRSAVYYRRYRENSAQTRGKAFFFFFHIAAGKIREVCKIYFSSPSDYSFPFYLTRVLASMKSLTNDTRQNMRRYFGRKQ